ncbi:hypothetical protein D1872_89820 [compost metagenome]
MAVTFKPGGTKEEKGSIPVGRSIVLYGPPFSGKTSTLQNDTNLRILLIDMDKNSSVVEETGNVDILGCDTFEDYLAIKEGIRAGKYVIPGGPAIEMSYDLYVIDSFTRFEELIKAYVVEKYAPKRKREIEGKFGAQTDWQDLQDHEVREVREMQGMTRRVGKPINVLWIGHDMEATNSDDFNRKLQLRLQGKYAAPGIMGAVDAVFYMFKQVFPATGEKPERIGFGIYTMDQGAAQAEARLSVAKRKELSKVVWFPKWGDILRTLGATNLPPVEENAKK